MGGGAGGAAAPAFPPVRSPFLSSSPSLPPSLFQLPSFPLPNLPLPSLLPIYSSHSPELSEPPQHQQQEPSPLLEEPLLPTLSPRSELLLALEEEEDSEACLCLHLSRCSRCSRCLEVELELVGLEVSGGLEDWEEREELREHRRMRALLMRGLRSSWFSCRLWGES